MVGITVSTKHPCFVIDKMRTLQIQEMSVGLVGYLVGYFLA